MQGSRKDRSTVIARKIRNFIKFYKSESRRLNTSYDYPNTFWIEPTSACNFKCTFCFQSSVMTRSKGFMDFSMYKRVIDEISPSNPRIFLHHSGESLLHKELPKMIEYGKNKGCYMMLHSNGSLMTEELAKAIMESHLDEISFSFEGVDKETFERIRVGGVFEEVIGNIRMFLELRNSMNSNTQVHLQIIEMAETTQHIDKFFDMYSDLGADKIEIQPLMDWAGDVEVNRVEPVVRKSYKPCGAPWNNGVILYNGDVVPCCLDFDSKYIAGNVNDESYSDIFNGDKMNKLRKMLVDGKGEDVDLCRGCPNNYMSYEPKMKEKLARIAVHAIDFIRF